jgi:hypothetical protein
MSNERLDAIFGPIREAYRHGNHAEVKRILEGLLKRSVDAKQVADAEKVDWENLTTFTIKTEDGEDRFVLHREP